MVYVGVTQNKPVCTNIKVKDQASQSDVEVDECVFNNLEGCRMF